MHLYYPHNRDSSNSAHTVLSPPKQDPSTNNRVSFSIFYTASLVFPALVTFGYWVILTPHDHRGDSEREFSFPLSLKSTLLTCDKTKTSSIMAGSRRSAFSMHMASTPSLLWLKCLFWVASGGWRQVQILIPWNVEYWHINSPSLPTSVDLPSSL